jgi:Tfp pilus assembly protein PilN
MIEINLLPEELKTKAKKIAKSTQLSQILYFIPLAFGILIIIHIYLFGVFITKNITLGTLNNKWKTLQPQRKILEDFKKGYEGSSQDASIIKQLLAQRIFWSAKLNKLSLNLPKGVWFKEFVTTNKNFILKGSVVSLQKEEMDLINKFIDNLKKDRDFFKDFSNLELTSVQRKVIGGYDVADFILAGALK